MRYEKKINYRMLVLAFYIPLLFFTKIFQFKFLPIKYFYDSRKILRCVELTPEYVDGAYRFTASLFRRINIFGFTTLLQWSIALTLVFGIIVYFIVYKKCRGITDLSFIYIMSTVFLLGVYVFNISKDIIQMSLFLIAAFFVSVKGIKNEIAKLVLAAGVFVFESVIFRSYYILVAAFTIYFYCVFTYMRKKGIQIKAKQIAGMMLFTIFVLYVFMLVIRVADGEAYNELITARSRVNIYRTQSADARTAIFDWIPSNDRLWLWMINYFINAMRMMFPIELFLKGMQYTPFIVFQMISTYYLVLAIKKFRTVNDSAFTLSLCIFCAYLLASFAFEPDFGSWVRHETACFPIFVNIVFSGKEVETNGG